jgi:hypothetical protein
MYSLLDAFCLQLVRSSSLTRFLQTFPSTGQRPRTQIPTRNICPTEFHSSYQFTYGHKIYLSVCVATTRIMGSQVPPSMAFSRAEWKTTFPSPAAAILHIQGTQTCQIGLYSARIITKLVNRWQSQPSKDQTVMHHDTLSSEWSWAPSRLHPCAVEFTILRILLLEALQVFLELSKYLLNSSSSLFSS